MAVNLNRIKPIGSTQHVRNLVQSAALAIAATLSAVFAAELALAGFRRVQRAGEEQRAQKLSQACPGSWRSSVQCRAAFEQGAMFDTRTKLDVVADLEADGGEVWPSVVAGLQLDIGGKVVRPLSGVSSVRTVFCNGSGTWVDYVSDEYGFNNPPGLYQPGRVQVMLVGDSYVHGMCVPSDKNISALLRRNFPTTISLGLQGNGPLSELASEREFARPHAPEFVVWVFFEENDTLDLEEEKDDPILMRYLDPRYSQGLMELQPSIDQALRKRLGRLRETEERADSAEPPKMGVGSRLREKAMNALTLSRLRSLIGHALRRFPRDFPFDEDLFSRVLRTAKEDAASWDGQLLFVYLPDFTRYTRPHRANNHRELILRLVAKEGIPIVDIGESFAAYPDVLSLFPRRVAGHYNEQGYAIVASEIERALKALSGDRLRGPPD